MRTLPHAHHQRCEGDALAGLRGDVDDVAANQLGHPTLRVATTADRRWRYRGCLNRSGAASPLHVVAIRFLIRASSAYWDRQPSQAPRCWDTQARVSSVHSPSRKVHAVAITVAHSTASFAEPAGSLLSSDPSWERSSRLNDDTSLAASATDPR